MTSNDHNVRIGTSRIKTRKNDVNSQQQQRHHHHHNIGWIGKPLAITIISWMSWTVVIFVTTSFFATLEQVQCFTLVVLPKQGGTALALDSSRMFMRMTLKTNSRNPTQQQQSNNNDWKSCTGSGTSTGRYNANTAVGGWYTNNNILIRNQNNNKNDVFVVRSSPLDSFDNNNVAVRDLLYKEHEDMLTKRGIYEEELMKFNYSPLLQQPLSSTVRLVSGTSNNNNKKQAKEKKRNNKNVGVGFGSSTKISSTTNKHNNNNNKKSYSSVEDSPYYKESMEYANILQRDGVVRIDNIFGTPPPPPVDDGVNNSNINNDSCMDETNNSNNEKIRKKDMIDELREFVTLLRMDSMKKVYNHTNNNNNNNTTTNNHNYDTIINPKLYKERFADVLLRNNRCDLKIPLIGKRGTSKSRNNANNSRRKNNNGSYTTTESTVAHASEGRNEDKYNIHVDNTDIVETALHHALTQSPISDTIRNFFSRYYSYGSDRSSTNETPKTPPLSPVLYELSSLISDPGSSRQTIHPDNPILQQQQHSTTSNTVPVLLTCFIALQDITEDMGPTVWLPGTHTAEYHDLFFQDQPTTASNESLKDHLLRTHPALIGTLKRGCCAIYDSRVLHCGSANKRLPKKQQQQDRMQEPKEKDEEDDNSRIIFYFSFRNPQIDYPGNPASIRDEIGKSHVTLDELSLYLVDAISDTTTPTTSSLSSSSYNNNNDEALLPNPFPWNR